MLLYPPTTLSSSTSKNLWHWIWIEILQGKTMRILGFGAFECLAISIKGFEKLFIKPLIIFVSCF